MSKKGIIISGGTIDDAFALNMIEEIQPDVIIGVDSGLNFLYRNQVMPTHIVGDFDSVDEEVIGYYKTHTSIPIQEFNPVKDATDTEIAMRLAIELEVEKLWLLGATGSRLDHVLANVHILQIALSHGVKAWIVDTHNRISLWENEVRLSKKNRFGHYFSLFPFDDEVEDLSIDGAKYPLAHYRMAFEGSRCVSNEFEKDSVTITFPNSRILLMETRDKIN